MDVEEAFRRNQHRLYPHDVNRRVKKSLPYVAAVLVLFGVFVCLLMNRTGKVREEVPVVLSAGGKHADFGKWSKSVSARRDGNEISGKRFQYPSKGECGLLRREKG